ncbi:hypothetical protein M9979_12130 [Sphingomonas sp. RP10(2022)]|uniref:Uncharacterized protein n=1 Tax=Sphingomonas liriopis TaxID=2949094 RepID=A0A9X2HWR6_9SPHN|nr:hypothetical protein [Sphingomonas liriopis]MCP3735621.1 hypothetical protein [Sphingomonas liriopis]
MTTKARDATGTVRTIDVVKVRGADGVLRTIDFIRVRGTDNVLREVFTAAGGGGGGGGGGGSNPTYISPGSSDTYGKTSSRTAYFTAYSSGATPSVYAWGLLDGNGNVVSGGTTSTAQLRVYSPGSGEDGYATFYCDMTVDGVVYRATCTMSHIFTASGSASF